MSIVSPCKHAVVLLSGQYLDLFQCAEKNLFIGGPSLRIALMSSLDWAREAVSDMMGYGLGIRADTPFGDIAIEVSTFPGTESVDETTLIPIEKFKDVMISCAATKTLDLPDPLPRQHTGGGSTREREVQERLCLALGGVMEAGTDYGRIDILTDGQVIEVKRASEWKSAVGQILVYGGIYPGHQKRIHLFDVPSKFNMSIVEENCSRLNIVLSVEGVEK